MSVNVLRADGAWWVARDGRAARIPTDATTTAELLGARAAVTAAASGADELFDTDVAGLQLDSPVTTPCRVVAQMVNYRSHAKESGFDPGKVQLPAAKSFSPGPLSATLELWGFGDSVTVSAPPADQVTDLSGILGSIKGMVSGASA